MAEFIISPGQTGTLNDTSPPVITLTVEGKTGPLVIDGLEDISMPMAKEIFSWTQMNVSGKRQIPTTSTNSISTNVMIDKSQFNGVVADAGNVAGSASVLGLFGLTTAGVKIGVTINMGDVVYAGVGYVTGITPTVSVSGPVWKTPITITVDGAFTVS